ncbi:lipocalin family protein [Tenacibaculum sp. SDUM215027]|uniref:lipocalin family protein n=1 Tax=Tenacibaculum sp. SDUM215027 TaxID=3422596 RepID=UPI003D322683
MKKILVLTIAMFSLFACSSDDENLDPIVGTWYKFSEEGIEASDCEKKSSVTFNENGTFNSISYESIEDKCVIEDELSATWTNKGNGVYSRTYNGESSNTSITFSDNGNTMTSVYKQEYNGETLTDITVFKRK